MNEVPGFEILKDEAFEDAFVTVRIGTLGEMADSPIVLRGLAQSNFFRTDLEGFAFAILPGDVLVIQDRIPRTLADDPQALSAYRRQAAAMAVRARNIFDILSGDAAAAREGVQA